MEITIKRRFNNLIDEQRLVMAKHLEKNEENVHIYVQRKVNISLFLFFCQTLINASLNLSSNTWETSC